MNYQGIITRDKEILGGKPIIKGTRLSVELILKKLSEGATVRDLLENYPHLQDVQVYAALEYTSVVVANEEIIDAAA